MDKRESGILLHISSLPGKYGIGDFGQGAYNFVDFLRASGQKNWQILPLGTTSYGDSPYQSFSAFAGNPYFIDLDEFVDLGYLDASDFQFRTFGDNDKQIDYSLLYKNKMALLKLAYKKSKNDLKIEISQYYKDNFKWLRDFGLFMSIKGYHDDVSWLKWHCEYQKYDSKTVLDFEERFQDEIYFWVFTQYFFEKQWKKLKRYANKNKVKIIGDLPIYVSIDSADVWSEPNLFKLDSDFNPITVAGTPPDAFSDLGQLWGNPIYNWDEMEKQGYKWWIKRMAHSFRLFDKLRIDHFRGFAAFTEIEFGREDAVLSVWTEGPGIKLFNEIKDKLGDLDIIVEDLGYITEDVRDLVSKTGFPNMKVIQFGLNKDDNSEHMPHNFNHNMVVYTGTHDNLPLMGWLETASKEHIDYAMRYFNILEIKDFSFNIIAGAWSSVANLAIAPIQDFLSLGSESRMNTPSQIGGNWTFRITEADLSKTLALRIKRLTHLYWR